MAGKIDWGKIKVEYQTTNISYRKLAEKYSIPFPTIRDRAKRENWASLRDASRDKYVTNTSQKVIERKAKKTVEEIDAALEATDLISKLALEALQDPRQFYLFPVEETTQDIQKVETETTRGISEKVVKLDSTTTIAKDLGILDARRLKDLASALSAATTLTRLIKGIMSESETQKLQLERERLEMDRIKAGLNDEEDNETGVVILPEVDVIDE